MRHLHFTCAFLLFVATAAGAQGPAPAATAYSVFLRGAPIGREEVTVQSDATGTTVVTEGRVSAPADLIIRRAEFKYAPDWSPQLFQLDATAGGADITLRTTVKGSTATTEGSQAGQPITISHAISPQAIVHANGIFGSYVALARRLTTTTAGSELRMYVVAQTEIPVRVASVQDERMQLGADFLDVRRYELVFVNPGGEINAQLTADRDGRLIGVTIPAQALSIVRADLAASTARTQVFSNPGDEPVTIPATGFNLGATITRPANVTGPVPVVVLIGPSAAPDRDGYGLGLPIIGQLAGALAEAGFITVRYDKRGYGQSGGRAESATLTDFAEDARAVERWLRRRKDVDPKRIALLGYGDGAWIAMIAAAREKRFAALVTIGAPASTGADLILEQQQQALNALTLTPQERDRRIALQKQIQTAVLTGKGWEGVPAEMRRAADTPWFQSLLAFNPARVIEDVRQPMLLLHGALDRQVPVAHLDKLAALAREDSDSKSIEVVVVKEANHLLVAGRDESIDASALAQLKAWLAQTFKGVR